MEVILEFDEYLFHLINSHWHIDYLDRVLPIWRNKLFWIPLYVFLISFILTNFKNAKYLLLTMALTVTIADTVSSKIVKQSVQRLRPCNNADPSFEVNLLVNCSPGYSFTSSHATNHFATAIFLILTLGGLFHSIRLPLLFWAASIAYAQVYVGAHYPLDVLFGSLLGCAIGWFGSRLFHRYWLLE